MSTEVVLKSLIAESKDGEWGKSEPFDQAVEMVVIRGTDFASVRMGDLRDIPVRFIPERIANRKTIKPLDILIETAGGTQDRPTGRTVLIKSSLLTKSALPLTCASFARFIRLDATKVHAPYLFWLLQNMYIQGIMRQYNTQHTGVSRFQFTTFSEREPLYLPSLNVQRKVADLLSAYDDLIENNTRRITILEEMAQMIYREWFVNFRFPSHERVKKVESEFGPIPSGWAYEPLEKGCQRITDGSHWSPKTVHIGFSMASVKDMHNWGIDLQRCRKITAEDFENLVRNDCKPLVGDVLIAKDGSYLKHCFWVQKPMGVVILSSIAILRPNELLKSSYLSLHLLDPQIKSRMAGYVSGVALPRIILKDFRNFRILLPPLDIQMDFARLTEPMLRHCWNLTEQNATLRDTRDLLLPKLISGDICVDQLETETAK